VTEPRRPGTEGESDDPLPDDSAAAPRVRRAGPEPAASRSSREEKIELHWAALNRRMDRLLEGMQTQRGQLSPPGPELIPSQRPPRPPAKPEEEPADRPAPEARGACPRCSGQVYPSGPHGFFELFLKLFGSGPLRCHACYYRYGEFMGMRFLLKN
jgi:hypothetical protein